MIVESQIQIKQLPGQFVQGIYTGPYIESKHPKVVLEIPGPGEMAYKFYPDNPLLPGEVTYSSSVTDYQLGVVAFFFNSIKAQAAYSDLHEVSQWERRETRMRRELDKLGMRGAILVGNEMRELLGL